MESRLKTRGFVFDRAGYEALEARRKALQTRAEALQAQRNALSKQIGQAKGKGEDASALLAEVNAVTQEQAGIPAELESVQASLDALLASLPNLPHENVHDECDRCHRADEGHIHHPREARKECRADRNKKGNRTELRNLLHDEQEHRPEQHADERGAQRVHRRREQHGECADAQHEHTVQCREYTDQDKVADFPSIHDVFPPMDRYLIRSRKSRSSAAASRSAKSSAIRPSSRRMTRLHEFMMNS